MERTRDACDAVADGAPVVAQAEVAQAHLHGSVDFCPDQLLDNLIARLGLKNDAALGRALEIAPPMISKIRHSKLPVSAAVLIRMHEVTGLSIGDLRYLMGDRRGKFRIAGH